MTLGVTVAVSEEGTALLCFSHLRWDWVWQRPQHLLTHLARLSAQRVYFIEEPMPHDEDDAGLARPGWQFSEVAPGITRCIPRFDATWPFFLETGGADTLTMRKLLAELCRMYRITNPLVWMYTPLALPLLQEFEARLVIYDCMDELALFAGAPPSLRNREESLLARADIVFAGGRSLHKARAGHHGNCHLFPSSVERAHFAGALAATTSIPSDARPGAPTFGFYGVLDERLDRHLLDQVAARRPDWSIVLVGPLAKIAPSDLPQRPNLHYLGQRPYADLPGYLKAWEVCLMPFAMNDATRFISPTKTLEYLAAEKPIVSTPVRDVVTDYGGLVRFGADPDTFIAACEAALAETPQERQERIALGRAILARTSWAETAARMQGIIERALNVAESSTTLLMGNDMLQG